MIDLVLNELSFRLLDDSGTPAASNVAIARLWMTQLVGTLRAGQALMRKVALRTDSAFMGLELCPDYNIPHWRNDLSVNKDERDFFRVLATKEPYLDGVAEEIIARSDSMDVAVAGISSTGLLAAMLLNSFAVSWGSSPRWDTAHLEVDLTQLDDAGEFRETRERIRHASASAHWEIHREFINDRLRAALKDGSALLANAQILFPFLQFGVDAASQIGSLTGSEKYFSWVIDCLTGANYECSRWVAGPFPHNRLPGPATGESKSVRRSPTYLNMRYFPDASGAPRLCEFHMKNRAENKRIHYDFDPAQRRILIAYVGDHLPTPMHRT